MENKKYTLNDVEILRDKTGVSYEEAVSLLDKYDGDMTRALIELEKRGQLGEKGIKINVNGNTADIIGRLWRKGCDTRLIVERDGERLVNLSALFMILALLLGWRLVIAGAILALALGCRVRLLRPGASEKTAPAPEAPEKADAPAETPKQEEKKPEDGFNSITIE